MTVMEPSRYRKRSTRVRSRPLDKTASHTTGPSADGPHVKGRHIDLSMASARAIGLDQARGLARVDLEIVKMGDGKRTFHGRTSYMGPEFRNQSRERRRYSDAMV